MYSYTKVRTLKCMHIHTHTLTYILKSMYTHKLKGTTPIFRDYSCHIWDHKCNYSSIYTQLKLTSASPSNTYQDSLYYTQIKCQCDLYIGSIYQIWHISKHGITDSTDLVYFISCILFILLSCKIISAKAKLMNEWGCRDAPHE